ncbi:MAG: PASTA domain-containing protein [Caulobacter sp.]|nr:PASTA domain-containing protein [Caulobacter sp.]
MPSFEIPDGPTTVALKTEAGFHKGSAVFNVTNKTGEGLTARFSVQVQGPGKAEWYSVQGEPEHPVAAGETQTVTVQAKIPAATPAGEHRIKLRVTNVNDPDNDSTDSTAATVKIPAVVKPPVKKKPFPWWIIAVAGGVLVLVIGVIVAVVLMSGGPKVPKVIGMDYASAVAELQKGGYAVAPEIRAKPPGNEPADKVFLQDPVAGTKGDPKTITVKLTVAGAATAAVPGVIGLEYPDAAAVIEKAGFKVGPAIEEVSPENALGKVFKQEPAADAQAAPGSEVKLTVAVGETVAVPNVTGKPLVAAQALLEERGFSVAAAAGKPSGQQPDAVLTQDPAGDTKAPKGGVVRLTTDPGVVVPDLVGPQLDGIAGIQTLKNAGADIGTIGSSCRGAPNKIVSQSIEPKTRVASGTRVNIVVASATASPTASVLCRSFVDVRLQDFGNQVRGVNNARLVLPK